MEAGIQLAVIEKLRSLISEDGLHVLCPPTPPVYSLAELDAIGRGGATAEELALESAWIRAVNVVPTPGSLSPAEPAFLWERLSELKAQPAEFAMPAASDEETPELEAAKALLYRNPEADARKFSDKYLAYLELRELHESAVQLFERRRGQALNSKDREVKAFWRKVARQSYQAEIDQALFNWQQLGRKKEIELAQRTLAAAAEREPEAQWLRWMAEYSGDVDNRSDQNLLTFVPTSFSPANVGSLADWPESVIEAPQMAALVAGAPADLQARFGGTQSDALRISFEYARLSIERSWFPRRAFSARFWRLRGSGPTWSDGGSPPSGQLPGYIVSALLVRNLSVVRPAAPSPAPPQALETALLANLVVGRLAAEPAPPAAQIRDHRRAAGAMRWARPGMVAAVRGAGDVHQVLDPAQVLAARAARGNFPSRITRTAAGFGALRQVDRDMQQQMALLVQPSIQTAPVPTLTESILGPTDACVVAYLWRAFPKCPDPDPGLRWPE